jgi:hypothetical protein
MVFGLVSAMVLLIAAPAPAFNVAEQPVALGLPVTWQPVARQPVASQHIDWRQEAPAARVDVNRADAERLQTVPGIGPATAGCIVIGAMSMADSSGSRICSTSAGSG